MEAAMSDSMPTQYRDEQLEKIIEEAMIYMCACPAQVAKEIRNLRNLYAYQRDCLSKDGVLAQVHERIAEAVSQAHADMERCLADILELEGWDQDTLTMPEGLRALQLRVIEDDTE
jgi:uncharacterized protein YqeY